MQTVDLRSHLDRRLPGGLGLLALAGFIIWKGLDPDQTGRLIFGLLVGFFGLLAVAERRFVVIDEQAGTLTKKLGIILAVKVRTLALAEIKGVALSVHFPKSHGKKGNSRRYRLSVAGPKDGAITEHGNEWYARR